MDVIFWSKAAGGTTVPGTDNYIDHVSLATDNFFTEVGEVNRAAAADLKIPYHDEDSTGTFHIGILARGGTIAGGSLVLEFGWQPDQGGK